MGGTHSTRKCATPRAAVQKAAKTLTERRRSQQRQHAPPRAGNSTTARRHRGERVETAPLLRFKCRGQPYRFIFVAAPCAVPRPGSRVWVRFAVHARTTASTPSVDGTAFQECVTEVKDAVPVGRQRPVPSAARHVCARQAQISERRPDRDGGVGAASKVVFRRTERRPGARHKPRRRVNAPGR